MGKADKNEKPARFIFLGSLCWPNMPAANHSPSPYRKAPSFIRLFISVTMINLLYNYSDVYQKSQNRLVACLSPPRPPTPPDLPHSTPETRRGPHQKEPVD